jgi:hypothetical protein
MEVIMSAHVEGRGLVARWTALVDLQHEEPARLADQIDLEHAAEAPAAGHLSPQGEHVRVEGELDERALAGDARVGAGLVAAEGAEELAVLVGEAVERVQPVDVAAHVLLHHALGRVRLEGGVRGERVEIVEDARLAGPPKGSFWRAFHATFVRGITRTGAWNARTASRSSARAVAGTGTPARTASP